MREGKEREREQEREREREGEGEGMGEPLIAFAGADDLSDGEIKRIVEAYPALSPSAAAARRRAAGDGSSSCARQAAEDCRLSQSASKNPPGSRET